MGAPTHGTFTVAKNIGLKLVVTLVVMGVLYLPTYSLWLNRIEMLWRHWRQEVTHGVRFERVKALVAAVQDFFANARDISVRPEKTASQRSVLADYAQQQVLGLYIWATHLRSLIAPKKNSAPRFFRV